MDTRRYIASVEQEMADIEEARAEHNRFFETLCLGCGVMRGNVWSTKECPDFASFHRLYIPVGH